MNFRNLFSISLLIAVFSLYSCNKDTVKVESFTPQGEVKPLQSFSVEFSHDLAPADKLDEWTTEPYIEFEPPIQGRFKWVLANTLIFSPDQPLEASQEYKAKINDKAVLFGNRLGTKFEKYEFATPHFDLTKVDFFWKQIPHSAHKLSVQANLSFSYPVEPTELQKYLEVSQGKQKLTDFQVVSDAAADVMAVNFGEIQQTQDAQDFKITIKKGLNSVLNKQPLQEDKAFEKELPSITRLAVTSVSSGFDDEGGWIEVRTTQEVDKDQLNKFVVLNPKPAQLIFEVSEDRFRIEGKMAAGTTLELKLKKDLPGLYGGTLDEEYTEEIILADLEPRLRFAEKYGTYLMRSGMQNLNIEATNVKNAKVSVYEVFKNNLLFFFYNNYSYSNRFYSYYREYDEEQRYDVDYYGKRLFEKALDFKDVRNSRESYTMNMGDALNQRFKGIYVVEVRSEEDYWMSDAKIVAISDLGIIARQSETELLVLVNSLQSADPVEGVKIDLISHNNQTLVSGMTDANGIARFSNLKADVEDFQTRMITAEKGDDFNFIDLRATEVETSRHDVGGKYIASDQYDAFIYSDRNIYRPGETAHLSAIFRTANLETVRDIPIAIKIITPQGKTLEEYQKTLNSEGSFDLGVTLPDYAQTGQYVMELYSGSDKFISSYRFSVEEFVPDKIRVNLETEQEIATDSKPLKIDVTSEYLFGAPAAGHKYEMDVSLRHQSYYSKKYKDFDFSDYSTSNSYLDNDFKEGSLDENGKATIEYNFPAQVKSGGFINGTARVSVFDVTGRTVTRAANFKAYPNKEFIGIKSPGYYYGTNKDISFDLVAVGPEDADINRLDVEVELVRYEWKTV
ncbi:MAG: hypothetical protein KDD99_25000, partial [Bacteroidetes bacterium]|nr:hypothetical protein [Bacteroidota bacterium]